MAETNPGWSINISSGNLPEDFGLPKNNATATAKKMISDLKKVSLRPNDILRAVDALTALKKKFEKELEHPENGSALELAKEYMTDVLEVSGKVLERQNPWQELTEADSGRASGRVQDTVVSAAVKVAELLSNRTEDFKKENIHNATMNAKVTLRTQTPKQVDSPLQ
ncbi:uncharacterized protein LOC119588132 [Penaeus monodon]|uniref:uncharacterized protein LOC119588132 n=1 Tax=Penaeus monodon TaxID=6687 RepID=UPI0018A6FFB2|nr:uncharacterized protein LOC119588132 [Penaeus monodon]